METMVLVMEMAMVMMTVMLIIYVSMAEESDASYLLSSPHDNELDDEISGSLSLLEAASPEDPG